VADRYTVKYILDGHDVVPVDLMTWARWFEEIGRGRVVAQSELPGGVWVSTVFIGIDHQWGDGPPLIFESMAFDGNGDEIETDRYSTWDAAEAGHAAMCEKFKGVAAFAGGRP
jgi:hypothetical protein